MRTKLWGTVDAETLKKIMAEAEKESRLKAERAGCGTPKRLMDAVRSTAESMEIEQYLGKKNSD